MMLESLKKELETKQHLIGEFTDEDIDFFIKNHDREYAVSMVKVNGVLIPFRRICIGTQRLSKNREDSDLLFISNGNQVQVRIRDIETLDFNPEWVKY